MTYMSSPDDRSGLSERAQMERLAAAKAEQRKRDAMRQGHHVEEDAMQPKLQDMIAECQRLCPSKRFALSDGINGGDVVWLAEIGNGTKDVGSTLVSIG